jgi:hypothetical protein
MIAMDPLMVSAQFAAYTWYTSKGKTSRKRRAAAMRFARANWEAFLPLAHKGLGRLLLRIASGRETPRPPPAQADPCTAGSPHSGGGFHQRFSPN